jgi:hypothetical protein
MTSKEGFGKEKTTHNSKTKIGGNYSNNKGRSINDITPRNRNTY